MSAKKSFVYRMLSGITICLLCSCASKPIPFRPINHQAAAVHVGSAEELLKKIREANDGYGTLKATYAVSLEIQTGARRSEKRSFVMNVSVQRPSAFRLTVEGELDQLLADIVYIQGQHKVIYLSDELQRSSQLPDIIPSLMSDLKDMLRLDPQPAPTKREMEESVAMATANAPLYELKEYQDKDVLRHLTVFASTFAVSRQETVDDRGDGCTISFGDYQTNGRLVIPRTIHVTKEGTLFYWLSINVTNFEFELPLDPDLFVAK